MRGSAGERERRELQEGEGEGGDRGEVRRILVDCLLVNGKVREGREVGKR